MVLLADEEKCPMRWTKGQKLIQIRVARYGWSWSGRFAVEERAEIPIRLRNDFDNTVFFVLVQVVRKGPRTFVLLKGGDMYSPYRFENHTLETFKVRQIGQSQCTNLLPYHCCAYAWDEPLSPHRFVVDMSLPTQWLFLGTFDFEKLQSIEQRVNERLQIRVIAQGPTRVFQLFDKRCDSAFPFTPLPKTAPSKYTSKTPSLLSGGGGGLSSAVELRVSISVPFIGLSVIDKSPQELIYLTIAGTALEYALHSSGESIELDIRRIQIDNQLWSTPYPCLLYPWSQGKDSDDNHEGGEDRQLPMTGERPSSFISMRIEKDFEYPGVQYFPLVTVHVSPFEVNVEGTLVMRFIKMASDLTESFNSHSNENINSSTRSGSSSPQVEFNFTRNYSLTSSRSAPRERSLSSLADDEYLLASHQLVRKALQASMASSLLHHSDVKVYVEKMEISEVKINLSIHPVVAQGSRSSSLGDQSMLRGALSTILLAILSSLAKIERCPIRFRSFELFNLFASSQKYLDTVAAHFALQAISQAYVIVGSSELLGNPLRLVQSLVTLLPLSSLPPFPSPCLNLWRC